MTFQVTIWISFYFFPQELAELASKATDQAEESESKVKTLRKEKDELLQAFSIEKQDLMTKLTQLQQIIADKDQELKVCKKNLKVFTHPC